MPEMWTELGRTAHSGHVGGRWGCGSYLSEAKSYIMETRSNWFVKHEVRFYKFNEMVLREMIQGLSQKGVRDVNFSLEVMLDE